MKQSRNTSQSSRKEDGLNGFMLHQMYDVRRFCVSKPALFSKPLTPHSGSHLHRQEGSQQPAQMDVHAWVCNYGSIGSSLLHSQRITQFRFINILRCVWKLFTAWEEQQWWGKECWGCKQRKDEEDKHEEQGADGPSVGFKWQNAPIENRFFILFLGFTERSPGTFPETKWHEWVACPLT